MLERGLAEGSRSKVAKAIAKRVLRDGGPHPNYFLFLGARLEQIPNLSEIQTAVQLHPTFLIPQMPVAVLKGFLPENLARGEGVLKVWARLRPYFLRNVGEVAAFADQFPNVWPEVVDLIKEKAESGAVGDMEGGFNTSGITGLFKWCMGRRDVAQESRNELAYWFYSRYRQHGPNGCCCGRLRMLHGLVLQDPACARAAWRVVAGDAGEDLQVEQLPPAPDCETEVGRKQVADYWLANSARLIQLQPDNTTFIVATRLMQSEKLTELVRSYENAWKALREDPS
ncbi:unnamed protein product [Symbiodinium natans]|uniref:Uncharacterized protein n=1 Tax=Symbiodinium natans TaxID=878477 RepID=A0A812K7M8_9DINO|nr:unnamed protein product [Symbiodinium natans]